MCVWVRVCVQMSKIGLKSPINRSSETFDGWIVSGLAPEHTRILSFTQTHLPAGKQADACVCVPMCVCQFVSVCVCVCVYVSEGAQFTSRSECKRQRMSMKICVNMQQNRRNLVNRMSESVQVSIKITKERERVCVREREREKENVRNNTIRKNRTSKIE